MPATGEAQVVLDLLDGFRASKALFAAVELRLFDRLYRGPRTTAELADELDCAPHALERLLGFCAAKGLIEKQGDGRWANLAPGERYLRVESPQTLTGYILYSDRILYRLWSKLGDALHEGTNRWDQEFGSKDDIFEHFFATDEEKETFLRGMHGLGLLSSPRVVELVDLSRFRRLVDWGGGSGHLAIEACRRYPDLRAIVFDLPEVRPVAERSIAEAEMTAHIGTGRIGAGRIEVAAGDFFTDPVPDCDLIAMGQILHDWSAEKVHRLLSKAYDALPSGGGLLIAERLLDEDKCGPENPLLQSLSMLVCTEGRERSALEYEALLREAGFREFEAHRTGGPLDVMLALK